MRLLVIKTSKTLRPILVSILILVGTVANFQLGAYAQNDTNYGSEGGTSEGSTNEVPVYQGLHGSDQSSEASDNNGVTDDYSQPNTDEFTIDKGVTDSQDNTGSNVDNSQIDDVQNSEPVADAGNDLEVDENSNVALNGRASTGDIISYSWTQTDGYPTAELSKADSSEPSFTAPDVDTNRELTFQLTVIDENGSTDIDTVDVLVKDTINPNEPLSNDGVSTGQAVRPSLQTDAVPGEDESSDQSSGEQEQPTIVEPVGPNNEPIQESPNIECTDNQTGCPQPEPELPPLTEPCLANETGTGCPQPEPELPPLTEPCLANETGTGCPQPEPELPPLTEPCLANETGTGDIAGCTPTSPTPQCPDDLAGNMTADCIPRIPPPQNPECPDGNMTGNVTACTPSEGNIRPVANAGENQIVDEDSTVTLDGNGSYDPDGDIVSYAWVQSAGETSVTLLDANTPSASFSVPTVDDNSTLTLELTVMDNSGNNDSDYIDVSIENTNKTTIPPISGTITLDKIPNKVEAGSIFVFSGTLDIEGINNYTDTYVQIKDSNNGTEDLLSFNSVDGNGRFVSQWTATPKQQPYKVYALYEDGYGNTLESNVETFYVNESEIQYRFESERIGEKPYIPIIFNDYKKSTLNVYVLAKDKSSAPYVSTVIKAIEHWSEELQKRSGNPSAWKFKIITDRDLPTLQFEKYRPHIVVNLEHKNSQSKCGSFSGCAHISWPQRLHNGHVVTWVFTGAGSEVFRHDWVSYITSHEFGHALGLGHTWNEGNRADGTDDMMCSSDYRLKIFGFIPLGNQVKTCNVPNDVYNDKGQPTEFDIRAVLYAYGIDGFQSPNRFLIPFISDYYTCKPLPDDCKPKGIQSKPTLVTTPNKRSEEDTQQVDKKLTSTKPISKKDTAQTDTKDASKVTKSDEVQIVDYRFITKIGFPGTGKGQILEPTDLSFDTKHNIMYVADKNNNRIQKLDINGNYLASWGSRGSGMGQFISPADLAVDNSANIIFVADLGNNRIQKFDTNGDFLDMWGSFGRAHGQFDHVGDIALDTSAKQIYVTDIGNHRVQKFDYDGKFITSWGSLGTTEGRFNRPAGLDYDSSGIVLVVDTKNNRIQKFDKEGNFLGMWGQFGKGTGQFDNPVSLNIDPTSNYLYVSDSGNKRIEIFDPKGNYINEWGIDGTADGEFERPVSIAFGNNGQVYVVDKDKNDIQVFGTTQ